MKCKNAKVNMQTEPDPGACVADSVCILHFAF
jgi:hypothetical protein